jgi:hypothetical protein
MTIINSLASVTVKRIPARREAAFRLGRAPLSRLTFSRKIPGGLKAV